MIVNESNLVMLDLSLQPRILFSPVCKQVNIHTRSKSQVTLTACFHPIARESLSAVSGEKRSPPASGT
eukprot:753634-Hanusia_phi.AAC.3